MFKTTPWPTAIAGLLFVATAALAWTLKPENTQAQARAVNAPLSFGILTTDGDKLVFMEGHRRTEITPPPGQLAGGRLGSDQLDNGYRIDAFDQRHDLPAAMDILAARGWNVVNLTQGPDGQPMALLRRVQ